MHFDEKQGNTQHQKKKKKCIIQNLALRLYTLDLTYLFISLLFLIVEY